MAETAKIDEMIGAIESMSVLELVELSKALQDKFGVSAAAPVAADPAFRKTAVTVVSSPTCGAGAKEGDVVDHEIGEAGGVAADTPVVVRFVVLDDHPVDPCGQCAETREQEHASYESSSLHRIAQQSCDAGLEPRGDRRSMME